MFQDAKRRDHSRSNAVAALILSACAADAGNETSSAVATGGSATAVTGTGGSSAVTGGVVLGVGGIIPGDGGIRGAGGIIGSTGGISPGAGGTFLGMGGMVTGGTSATSGAANAAGGAGGASAPTTRDASVPDPRPSSAVFGYPTGDKVTYPAGGGGWWVSQVLGHWSSISPFIGNHLAEDIRNDTSDNTTFQPVYSIGDGTVLYAGPNGSTYVNVVLIRHDVPGLLEPICSFYGHIDGLTVQAGDVVARGQQVARIMDWNAHVGGKNSHLHYAILPWDLCQASDQTDGALVCGYDNGPNDAFHQNLTLDQEPETYKAVDTPCLNQNYGPFIAPSKFIRAHGQ